MTQTDARGRPTTVMCRSYASPGGAGICAKATRILDKAGKTLLRFPVEEEASRRALRLQLGCLCA